MGVDKAFVTVGGITLVERAVAAAWAAGAGEVRVVGGDQARLARLGLTSMVDEHPGDGPLGAIITALAAASLPRVLVVPCDLIAPTAPALAAIVTAMTDANDAAVPVVEDRAQWATAAWSVRCLPALRVAFDAGVRAPREALKGLSVARFVAADGAALADADTPDDLPEGSAWR